METRERYAVLDAIRGFALINMVVYHGLWDLVHLFDIDISWYPSQGTYIWQQWICWTFIFVSGFCQCFGKRKLRRALLVLFLGAVMTLATYIFMPEGLIQFGILTLLGSCMLLMIPLETVLKKVNPIAGMIGSILLFVLTRNVNSGYLGFEDWNLYKLPRFLYRNMVTTYLGFKEPGFYSTDYFSLIPWVFLFMCGYFTQRLFEKKNLMKFLKRRMFRAVEWFGRHSLIVYVLHQPIIYLVLGVCANLWK